MTYMVKSPLRPIPRLEPHGAVLEPQPAITASSKNTIWNKTHSYGKPTPYDIIAVVKRENRLLRSMCGPPTSHRLKPFLNIEDYAKRFSAKAGD